MSATSLIIWTHEGRDARSSARPHQPSVRRPDDTEDPVARKRNPRTASLVRSALADLLETEVQDPRVKFVTLTEVDVTPDHEVATVYYTTLDPSIVSRDPRRTGGDQLHDADDVAEGLESVTPRLRSLLGRRVPLRTTPELRFRPDPVADTAGRVDELLRRLGPGGVEDTDGDDEEAR
jgi:ribosome-binding factor A